MEVLADDLISLFQYLLPGFVAAWIFYGLTSYAKPSQFERVVQALIFTLFIQAAVLALQQSFVFLGRFVCVGQWTESVGLMWSVVAAVVFGVGFSYFANNDKLHKWFRNKNVTRETSFPSEWFGTFLKHVTFVVLHLHDERRLYGWPIEWPSEPSRGHFVIADPSWLENGSEKRITGVDNILIDVRDVKWVEFMEKTWEDYNVKERLKSATATAAS